MTSFISSIDLNRRPDPVFTDFHFLNEKNIKRIVDVAIPFLNLHQGMGQVISIGSATRQIYHHLQEENPDLKKVAYLTMAAAFTLFQPSLSLFLTHGSTFIFDLYAIYQDPKELNCRWQDVLSTAVYLSSAYYGTPFLIIASLFLQACKEFEQARFEYEEGRYLEMIGKICMGLIRSGKVCQQTHQLYRAKVGKKMTQADWDWVIKEVKEKDFEQKPVGWRPWITMKNFLVQESKLEKILSQYNFRKEFKDLKISSQQFKGVSIQNVRFTSCSMVEASFREASIENVAFDNCLMKTADFAHAHLRNTRFFKSNLSDASFYQAKLDQCLFFNSDLRYVSFNDSILKSVEIVASKLFGANFLHAEAQKTCIKTCDLTDVLLADAKEKFNYKNCTENRFTRPIIALGWDFDRYSWSFNVDKALKDQGALVLKHAFVLPELDSNELCGEVRQGMRSYQGKGESMARHLLIKGPWGAQTEKIYEKAKFIGEYANGAIIPGGADVEKEFYKPVKNLGFKDYRKSMKEYAVIHEFVMRKKALMGICRGAQIVNTYFPGGTIKNVADQIGLQKLKFESNQAGEKIKQLMGERPIWGVSAHRQAVDQVGQGLEVALKANGVIKALISEDNKVFLTQFHPEYYLYAPKEGKKLNQSQLTQLSVEVFTGRCKNGHPITPNLVQLDDGSIEIDRSSIAKWAREFEININEQLQRLKSLRENRKLIEFFLKQVA